jgi:transketolase
VHLALEAGEELARRGVAPRVVSMPSWEVFEEQPAEYRLKVLPPGVPKVAVEAGSTLGWHKWVGDRGAVVGLDRFGASAPGKIALERLGFNVENVVERSLRLLKGNGD